MDIKLGLGFRVIGHYIGMHHIVVDFVVVPRACQAWEFRSPQKKSRRFRSAAFALVLLIHTSREHDRWLSTGWRLSLKHDEMQRGGPAEPRGASRLMQQRRQPSPATGQSLFLACGLWRRLARELPGRFPPWRGPTTLQVILWPGCCFSSYYGLNRYPVRALLDSAGLTLRGIENRRVW